jgi:predicted HicB family RNase H-like nuclease
MVQVNVRIPPELHTRLTERAAATTSTVTTVVTEALTKFLASEQGGKGK